MAVIGPEIGSYALHFKGTVTASTPYYPADGRGGKTLTETDSFVRDADLCQLTYLVGSIEAQNAEFTIYDGDGNEVFSLERTTSVSPIEPIMFGENGPVIQGNWYVESTDTTPEWNIGFKVLASR